MFVLNSLLFSREYADLYRVILCRDCNKKSTVLFHIVAMKCGLEGCGSYNTSMDGGPLLRKTGDETFTEVTDQEMAALSNVEFPLPPELSDSDIDSEISEQDDDWETTEELDDDDRDNID